MNKRELVEVIAKDAGLSKKDAENALKSFIDNVEKSVKKGESVQIIGFGTFEARKRAARTARNPQTGETIKIKATRVPAFKPGKAFKDAVAKGKK